MGIPIEMIMARLTPEQRAKVETRAKELIEEEMTLRDLRKAQARSQKDLARLLGVKQASISNIEARSDILLSTLRKYVQAMGGNLTLTVSFSDRPPVVIKSLSSKKIEDKRARPRGSTAKSPRPRTKVA